MIYTTGKFENLPTTILQTEAIVNDYQVNGVRATDVKKILSLKRGFQLITSHSGEVSLDDLKKINQIVQNHLPDSSQLRTVNAQVPLTNDVWLPPIPNQVQTQEHVERILKEVTTATEKAIHLNLYLSRWQQKNSANFCQSNFSYSRE